jgi:hypothetical protein
MSLSRRSAWGLAAIVAAAALGTALCYGQVRAGRPGTPKRSPAERSSRADSIAAALRVEEAWALYERTRLLGTLDPGSPQSPGVPPMVNFARATLTRAENALKQGRFAEALDVSGRARETLRIAAQLQLGEITEELLHKRLLDVHELELQARNLASACPVPGIRALMAQADERLRLAREDTTAGRLDHAEAETTIVRELYTRIIQICAR